MRREGFLVASGRYGILEGGVGVMTWKLWCGLRCHARFTALFIAFARRFSPSGRGARAIIHGYESKGAMIPARRVVEGLVFLSGVFIHFLFPSFVVTPRISDRACK